MRLYILLFLLMLLLSLEVSINGATLCYSKTSVTCSRCMIHMVFAGVVCIFIYVCVDCHRNCLNTLKMLNMIKVVYLSTAKIRRMECESDSHWNVNHICVMCMSHLCASNFRGNRMTFDWRLVGVTCGVRGKCLLAPWDSRHSRICQFNCKFDDIRRCSNFSLQKFTSQHPAC